MKVIVYSFREVAEDRAAVQIIAWAFALGFRPGIACGIAKLY